MAKKILQHIADSSKFARFAVPKMKKSIADVQAMLEAKKVTQYTPMQLQFWAACYLIPEGTVVSYATLSKVVQEYRGEDATKARYARMAGGCMAKNHLAPTVPCHRVVGSSGSLTGFVGETKGEKMDKKADMLRKEGLQVNNKFFIDTNNIA